MRILLTGASGYLGLHLLSTLVRAGHGVTAFVRQPQRLGTFAEHPRVRVHQADLLDDARVAEAVQDQEACVHAGFVWGAPGTEFRLLDTVAATKLFDAAGRAGVRRTVLVSSTAVHRPFTAGMREVDALTPSDIYGATKAAAELFLWSACATHAMNGVVLRAGPIVGAPATPNGAFKSDHRIVAMVQAAVRSDAIRVVRGEARQFVAVQDVARAVSVAVESSAASGTYLCVDRELTSWESIAQKTVEITQSDSSVIAEDSALDTESPCFDDGRISALLGEPLDSRSAMEQHLAHLLASASERR